MAPGTALKIFLVSQRFPTLNANGLCASSQKHIEGSSNQNAMESSRVMVEEKGERDAGI